MKSEVWEQLLEELISATQTSRVRWKPTDRGGSVIAPLGDQSVVVNNVSDNNSLVVASRFVGPSVEIRSADGEPLADVRVDPTGTATLSRMIVGESDATEPSTIATASVVSLIDRLVDEIQNSGRAGERAALDIIGQLRSQRVSGAVKPPTGRV